MEKALLMHHQTIIRPLEDRIMALETNVAAHWRLVVDPLEARVAAHIESAALESSNIRLHVAEIVEPMVEATVERLLAAKFTEAIEPLSSQLAHSPRDGARVAERIACIESRLRMQADEAPLSQTNVERVHRLVESQQRCVSREKRQHLNDSNLCVRLRQSAKNLDLSCRFSPGLQTAECEKMLGGGYCVTPIQLNNDLSKELQESFCRRQRHASAYRDVVAAVVSETKASL